MKKRFILTVTLIMLLLPGCITPGTKVPKAPEKIAVWWGTKEEVKKFLDSDNAQAKRWVVESVGE
jgi:hypothetical protein